MMYQVSTGGSTSVNVWETAQSFAANTSNAFNFTASYPSISPSAAWKGTTTIAPAVTAKRWGGSISESGTFPVPTSYGYTTIAASGGLVTVKPGHPIPILLNITDDLPDPDAPQERVQNRRMFR